MFRPSIRESNRIPSMAFPFASTASRARLLIVSSIETSSDWTLLSRRCASPVPASESAIGKSSILHSYCDRIASWRHTWKALRDQGAEDGPVAARTIVKDLEMATSNRIPVLTPQGHLVLAPTDEARTLPGNLQERLEAAFERGAGHGLLELGIREIGTALPAEFAYWRDFAGRYVTTLCTSAQPAGVAGPVAPSAIEIPPAEMLAELVSAAPPMPGGEYLNADVLAALWEKIDEACRTERAAAKQTLQEFLNERNPAWHLVGRVPFNLAENRSDEEAPFAFIATYTTRLSAQARAQHVPLVEALREYAGANNKARLLSLLKPVQEGARECAWLKAMVESGEIYHPLRWSAAETLRFLTDVPKLEAAGIVVRSPSA